MLAQSLASKLLNIKKSSSSFLKFFMFLLFGTLNLAAGQTPKSQFSFVSNFSTSFSNPAFKPGPPSNDSLDGLVGEILPGPPSNEELLLCLYHKMMTSEGVFPKSTTPYFEGPPGNE
ncbi:hypothetical protein HYV11_02320 [Candidatus Dependentiae bacterium]|nr:hypothetical protein [Candidatus Dependentiae bacterium]